MVQKTLLNKVFVICRSQIIQAVIVSVSTGLSLGKRLQGNRNAPTEAK